MTNPYDLVELGSLVADMDANAVLARHAPQQRQEDRPDYLAFMVDQLRLSLEGWSLLLSHMNVEPKPKDPSIPVETDELRIIDGMEVDARIARDIINVDETRRPHLVVLIVARVEGTLESWTVLKAHAAGDNR